MYPVISDNPAVQKHYEEMRARGESHRLAEMLATRVTPGLMTDSVFLSGHCNGNQFERTAVLGDYYRRVAEQAGQSTRGKVYLSGLAEYPGDPKAWVAGRGDVRRVLDERGWGAEGAVNCPVTNLAPVSEKYRVADDLVAARAEDLAEKQPEAPREELLEKARAQLEPQWK